MIHKELQASAPRGPRDGASDRGDPVRAAAGADWLGTIGQEIARVPLLLRHMRATWEVPGIDALQPAALERLGIRGLVWDVDGTLMRRGDTCVAGHLQSALDRLLAGGRMRHAIVSNCGEARFLALSRIFPGVPLLRVYRAPTRLLRRLRLGEREHWSPGAPAPGELEAARALRKPSPELMRFALAQLELPAGAVAVIGDQRLTDIACANLAGLRSIKVETLGRESFPLAVRCLQRAEEVAYRVLYRRAAPGGGSLAPSSVEAA